MFYIIGDVEMIILTGFLLGIQKFWAYGFVLAAHAISTLSSYRQYTNAFEAVNMLFYAAWPMLAACYALFILRDQDTLLTLNK